MKDSKGNKISIGDRVTVLWGFDNNFHEGNIVRLGEKFVDYNKKTVNSDKMDLFQNIPSGFYQEFFCRK